MRRIYLDYNSSTPVAPAVREAMRPFLAEEYGNPSSLHAVGARARKALDDARETVARLLGAESGEIVFTSGGTESDHLALRGVVKAAVSARGGGPVHVVTTAVEHSAVLRAVASLEEEGLIRATRVKVDSAGRFDFEGLKAVLCDDTVLVSVMFANNETGNVYPVAEIGRLCRDRGIVFHSDAVQALGKIPVDLQSLPVDLVSFSAHKIYGPKGLGALFVRRGVNIVPMVPGAQEMEKRGGTENLPGIVGFAAALDLAVRDLESEASRLTALRDELEKGLSSIPGTRIHGRAALRVPNTLNVSFEGAETNAGVLMLDREGIYVSSGSACASGATRPSHVLLAMGVPRGEAKGAIRFSLGRGTSREDIEYVLEKMSGIVARWRASH